MAYAHLRTATAVTVDSHTATTSAADFSGCDLIILHVATYEATSGSLATGDTNGNTYNALNSQSSSFGVWSQSFYCQSPIGDLSALAVSASCGAFQGFMSIVVEGFSGSVASPNDQNSGNIDTSGTATSIFTGTVTPSESNELVTTMLGLNGSTGTVSIDSGFSTPEFIAYSAGVNFGIASAYKIKNNSSSENPQWSWSSGAGIATVINTFKTSGGGGGDTLMGQVLT